MTSHSAYRRLDSRPASALAFGGLDLDEEPLDGCVDGDFCPVLTRAAWHHPRREQIAIFRSTGDTV